MKATSKAQQKAAGAVLSAKRGEKKPSELYDASKGLSQDLSKDISKDISKDMHGSKSAEELEGMASTQRKDKPQKRVSY
ncbi:DUF3008 family protein [Vreelandella venusta]|uniref:DUF3008 family protein n=1 Tax=Vreelandella venusta TaxID=44935 RepID=UPI002286358E|nr:DUF3008 family protein [Halomonas venusta]WAM57557.1 DUF3008 family protein [Halomonas venusta]